MQYKTGTVTVTNGSATVTGSGTAWLNEIQAGHVFVRATLVSGKRVDDPVLYTVASVQSNTQLTLTAPYGGDSGSGQLYGITRDFTPMGKPLLAQSSIGTVPVFNEAVLKLEQQSEQVAAGLGSAAALNVATNAQALAGTAGVLPDAAGVRAAFNQFGLGANGGGDITDFSQWRPNGFYNGPGFQPNDAPFGLGARNNSFNIGSPTYGVEFFLNSNATDASANNLLVGRRWRGGSPNSNWMRFHHHLNGATESEALAGSNNEKWMSPLRVREALIYSSPRLMRNVSGSSIAADANNAGSGLRFTTFNSSGTIAASATAPAGTWRNVAGVAVANNEYGLFMRVV